MCRLTSLKNMRIIFGEKRSSRPFFPFVFVLLFLCEAGRYYLSQPVNIIYSTCHPRAVIFLHCAQRETSRLSLINQPGFFRIGGSGSFLMCVAICMWMYCSSATPFDTRIRRYSRWCPTPLIVDRRVIMVPRAADFYYEELIRVSHT